MSDLEVTCRHRFDGGFGLNLEFVSAHRTTAVFGPSGAGKTSLLMLIAGFLTPDVGRVVWDGRVLVDTTAGVILAPERRRLGVVFQDQRLFPHLSVESNLRFGEGRRTGEGAAAPFDRIVRVLDLAPLLTRRPITLSGGERQRVALGRALMCVPDLLLLDEPVAAVDEQRRYRILGYVDRVVHEWNLPMLYVSHQRAEVQRLADWVVALDGGCLTEQGEPDQVLGAGEVVAAGEAVNLLRLERLRTAADGGWLAHIRGDESELVMRLPATREPPSDPTFVQFAATDVMLGRGPTPGLSARNRLPATVVDLIPRGGRVFVSLRLGDQRLWAEVTTDAVEELELRPGAGVTCLIKSAALRVVE